LINIQIRHFTIKKIYYEFSIAEYEYRKFQVESKYEYSPAVLEYESEYGVAVLEYEYEYSGCRTLSSTELPYSSPDSSTSTVLEYSISAK